jgi:hypothetical protein
MPTNGEKAYEAHATLELSGRTIVRYTHIGYEQTRQTAEALSQILE